MLTTKDQLLKAIKKFPQNISFDDAIEELYLVHKINKGLDQANKGQTISHKKVKERMKKWLK